MKDKSFYARKYRKLRDDEWLRRGDEWWDERDSTWNPVIEGLGTQVRGLIPLGGSLKKRQELDFFLKTPYYYWYGQ